MLLSTPILDMVSVSNNHERGQDPGVLSFSIITSMTIENRAL